MGNQGGECCLSLENESDLKQKMYSRLRSPFVTNAAVAALYRCAVNYASTALVQMNAATILYMCSI